MPAMKIAMSVLACVTALLAGCGVADQYATFLPKVLRQPATEPPAPEPEPDVKEMVRVGADTLFTARPTAVAVSRPHRIAGRGFSACVKAMVAGPMNPEPQPITLLVIIEHGKFADRHRATSQDGCATETYEKVEVMCRASLVEPYNTRSFCLELENVTGGSIEIRRQRVVTSDGRTTTTYNYTVA
jgi:hypothetical protein